MCPALWGWDRGPAGIQEYGAAVWTVRWDRGLGAWAVGDRGMLPSGTPTSTLPPTHAQADGGGASRAGTHCAAEGRPRRPARSTRSCAATVERGGEGLTCGAVGLSARRTRRPPIARALHLPRLSPAAHDSSPAPANRCRNFSARNR